MKADTYTKTGSKASTQVTLPEVFASTVNDDLITQSVYIYLSNQRQANAHAKKRGEVSGGGKKPWRQKGTGRARHGSTRSPIWTGGSVTFGPRNTRNFKKNLSKKMRKAALASALASKAAAGKVVVFDSFDLTGDKKTATLEGALLKAGLEGKMLIVQGEVKNELIWAAANLFDVTVTHIGEVNPYMIVNADVVVFTKDALDMVSERYDGVAKAAPKKTDSKKSEAKPKKATAKKTTTKKTTAKKTTKKTTSKAKKS